MASKRKLNGSTSVRCVEDSMKKCACETWKFFFLAAVDQKVQDTDITEATKHFICFQREGANEYPQYRIPGYALRFAEKVHTSKSPQQLVKELWAFARATAPVREKKVA